MTMQKLSFVYLAVLSCVFGESTAERQAPTHVLHPQGANYREAPGQVLFCPDGKLYVAFRVPEKSGASRTLRVIAYNALTGQQSLAKDYPVPSVILPRVANAFSSSQDCMTLVFAELHSPEVLVTVESNTLKLLSASEANLFGSEYFAPHVSEITDQSLVLSAGKLTHEDKATTVREVRELKLNPRNLGEVISEKSIGIDNAEAGSLEYWQKRAQTKIQVDKIVPLRDGALGLTNKASQGSIQLFDQAGKQLASLQGPDCGFVSASLSWDQQVGVAVCEKTGQDEAHFGQTLRRDAVVLELKTLRVLATIPMSRESVKERGSRPGDLWVAAPSLAVWDARDEVLVAISDFPDSIGIYSVAKPE